MGILAGIHPVREALVSGQALDRVLVARGAGGARIQEIVDLCRERSVPVRFEERKALDRVAGSASHQGVVALGASARYADAGIFEKARMLVVLDGIEDPHNLGAIIRTAHAAGVDAVVVPERRAAGLTDTVAKAAAGALAHMPVVRAGNISRTLEALKERGYWIYGLDERGAELYDQVEYAAPAALVLGAEGKGLHEHVRKHCDFLVRIPLSGKISSLNVSVAAGIALFAWKRSRETAAR
ncbi:MAG: 23S rRNA (guanosine(2251)-2'-O)-methyltransferase RlmB [Bryobacteraceae bacterium]|nr:23S rRNA (guanosine(2251)-2'-O)-methyltransferase RlmB [Bryobacteraceae bacterium]